MVPWFSDPRLTYLRSYGYNSVLLPRADVNPLQMLSKSGKTLERLGELSAVLLPGGNVAAPVIKRDQDAANISGSNSGYHKIGTGLSILGSIIGAMGVDKLGLQVIYKNAKALAFEFTEVLEDTIDITSLDHYLVDADINPFSRYASQLLESDRIYVITKTIKSKKVTVNAKSSSNMDVDADIPMIQEVLGGALKVYGKDGTTSSVTYEGNSQLVFGFQAIQLFYDNGRYQRLKPLQPGIGMRDLERVVAQPNVEFLMEEDPFISINGTG